MTRGSAWTLLTAGALALAAMFGSVSDSSAQSAPGLPEAATDFSAQQKKRARPAKAVAPRVPAQVATPRGGGPRVGGQRNAGPRVGSPRFAPRSVGPRTLGPRVVVPRGVAPRIGGGPGVGLQTGSFRGGAGAAMIRGRNFSVWRGGPYRVRRGNNWRTFVALSTLGALTIGAAVYYPYAYIDAPAPLCEGLTEDACELRWQEVPMVDGALEFQCVAYCPQR